MKKSDRSWKKNDFDPERQRKMLKKSARHKKVMAEQKKFKRNQQPRAPRRKDWAELPIDGEWDEGLDGDDVAIFERIMPRDEAERRRAVERAALPGAGLDTAPDTAEDAPEDAVGSAGDEVTLTTEGAADGAMHNATHSALRQGRVVEVSSGLCRVAVGAETLLCSGRGLLYAQESGFTNAVTVGDQVLVRQDGGGQGVVEQVLPRRSLLARPDVFYPHLQQVVVANVDQLLIVASWREPIIWYELIDRYLIAAARNHLPAVICVNKVDLAESRVECERELQPYQALGIPILLTSAQTGDGIPDLRAMLHGRTTVLAGLSGVGKSSLLTAVQPGLHLRVGLVSARKHEGRHTTTQATLFQLNPQTCVVDTPGIREFGLSGLTRSQLVTCFAEMAAAAAHCRYRNCSHLDEPGCAVQAAVARGAIAPSRMHSYRLIYASLPASL